MVEAIVRAPQVVGFRREGQVRDERAGVGAVGAVDRDHVGVDERVEPLRIGSGRRLVARGDHAGRSRRDQRRVAREVRVVVLQGSVRRVVEDGLVNGRRVGGRRTGVDERHEAEHEQGHDGQRHRDEGPGTALAHCPLLVERGQRCGPLKVLLRARSAIGTIRQARIKMKICQAPVN